LSFQNLFPLKDKFDILIVGAGIAGLSQAIALAEKDPTLSIGVVSKSALEETNTRLAQGGIAAVMSTQTDSYLAHIQDTLNASQQKANKEVVTYVVENAHKGIHQLENWGVQFDQVKNQYHLGLEGGHSQARILHVKDQTGAAVHDHLIQQVKEHSSIVLIEFSEVVELLLNKLNSIGGALIYNHLDKLTTKVHAKVVVLATGGIGQLFQYTTNSSIATGDGIALANNIGAEINNLQAIQFHPTAFRESGKNQLFLISEAVRGAGAHIINKKGERFVFRYDERGELATRDVISSAIYQELKESVEDEVYLDCRHLPKALLEDEFPFIYAHCLKAGFDLSQQPVPIIPAAHYSCGGIQVNLNGETSISLLYAIGECANTGLHGNNRLASNSLLEAIVFTQNVANNILENIKKVAFTDLITSNLIKFYKSSNLYCFEHETIQLKTLLTGYFISKDRNAKKELSELLGYYQKQLKDISPLELSALNFRWRLILVNLLLKEEALDVNVGPVNQYKLQRQS